MRKIRIEKQSSGKHLKESCHGKEKERRRETFKFKELPGELSNSRRHQGHQLILSSSQAELKVPAKGLSSVTLHTAVTKRASEFQLTTRSGTRRLFKAVVIQRYFSFHLIKNFFFKF